MPLQTLFYDKISNVGTTQLHPLGTERIEQDKIYKYVKAGGTITADSACEWTGQGTVVLFTGVGPGAGWNWTGASRSSGDYFWMQTHGEVGGLDTDTGITGVGYPVGVTDADGTTLADPTTGITWLGESVCAVKHASAGIIYLAGLT